MKIGVDARALLSDHPRGEGKTLLRLYSALAAARPDWQFVFFGQRNGRGAALLIEQIPHAAIVLFDPPGYRWNTWENIGLPLYCLRHRVSVLHSFSSGGPSWCPVPQVLTIHDLIPILFDDGLSPEAVHRFDRRLRSGVRAAAEIVVISESTRQDLLRLCLPSDPRRISTIYWGALSSVDHANNANCEPSCASKKILAFGGGGAKRKNAAGVMEMFARVVAVEPLARLTFIGVSDRTERMALVSRAQELHIADSVELLGFISDAELETLFSSSNCLVYLSLYEGFGLPPLEAMVRGVPVVASNTSAIPEVLGDTGILVDPLDAEAAAHATLNLLRDSALRSRLSLAARARAAQFRWDQVAAEYLKVFEKALSRR